MSFVIQGWCPGALRPMMSGDGMVVRVRPRMARLSTDQAHGLALASLAHGNGLIDVSARGNVQLRGVRAESHLALLDDLQSLGLLDPDLATETRRNIVVSPFWQPGDEAIVSLVEAVLTDPAHANLPGKFGVSVDPASPVLRGVAADIRLERWGGAWFVQPDGFATGALTEEPEAAMRVLLSWFLTHGVQDGRGRMHGMMGRNLPPGFAVPMRTVTFAAKPGLTPLGWMAGLPFGQMRAETLRNLSKNPVRITPWRMILSEGCQDAPSDLITDPHDPLLRVVACTGAPGCPQALQPTRNLARHLAPQVPSGQALHIAGCAKGCAHPGAAEVTLCATETGFNRIENGRAMDRGAPWTTSTPLFKAL